MKLSKKYKAFLKHSAPVEFLEGTTFAGKTTIGIIKFMLKVAQSSKKLHIISALDLGTIEKNILVKDLGVLEVFQGLVEYNANGKGGISIPHLVYQGKVIYLLGYDNKAKWKKALGGQYGCLYIDEINIADMEYIREASMRCDYLMGTLNPDDPNLPVYKEYINRSRSLPEWEHDTPTEILKFLKEPEKPGWTHWFFSFKDNAGATQEKIDQIMGMLAPGSKIWKNKIQGLRGRHTGLILPLDEERTIIKASDLFTSGGQLIPRFRYLACGIDTSYSRQSDDRISFSIIGIDTDGILFVLANEEHNNTWRVAHGQSPLAPSDVPALLLDFIKRHSMYGLVRDVFIDSADQATLTECEKYKRNHGILQTFAPAYKQTKIIDRITLQLGWMAPNQNCYFILDTCKPLIQEHNVYSWKDDKQEPEDANDHNINATQYAWLPYKLFIGRKHHGTN